MKRLLFSLSSLLIVAVISCNKHEKTTIDASLTPLSDQSTTADKKELQQKIPVAPGSQNAADSTIATSTGTTVAYPDWDKKIIKTGKLSLQVKDLNAFSAGIHTKLRQYGGYIAQEELQQNDANSGSLMTIKVPVAQFEPLMNELPAGSDKILERKITSDDVSEEVVDTRSRLEAKRQVRLKYLDFLKASKNTQELLKVQDEVNSIQEEMESASARINFLSHQTAYSTITLSFKQLIAGTNPSGNTASFWSRIAFSLSYGIGWIQDLLVALASIWPLILLLIAGIFIWKANRPAKVQR